MFSRMPEETQNFVSENNNQMMNNSYMNISVLDQSYCIGTSNTNKSEKGAYLSLGASQLMQQWKNYSEGFFKRSDGQ